ncbi:MAG: hypothetical protein ACYC1D_12430 [Acidimicrobiales bacterium]
MTGVVGILLALVAGWLVFDRRRAAMVMVVPFLVVLGVQTWHIAAGKAVSPPSTVNKFPDLIGYCLVQVIILALALGAGNQVRMRRATAAGPTASSSKAPQRTRVAVVINTAISALVVAAFLGESAVFDPGSVVHHSTQAGPPLLASIAIGLSAVIFAIGGFLTIKGRRTHGIGAGGGAASKQRAA